MTSGDRAGEFGRISVPALQRIRTLWLELEPLVETTAFDNVIAPTELQVVLSAGINAAETARLDIQWSEHRMYSFHYVDATGLNWRFDRHPTTHSPEKQFHPPPTASTDGAVSSCIEVEEVSLVTRAVHTMWRVAYDQADTELLNSATNPP